MLPGFLSSHACAESGIRAVEEYVGPGHLGSLAKPAVIVGASADPLQEDRGAPVAGSDLCRCPRDGVLGSVHARFLRRRRWDFLHPMVFWVRMPGLFRCPETLRSPELEEGEGGDRGPCKDYNMSFCVDPNSK